MISVVLMAALATAPDANANLFKRGARHAAPACCGEPAPCNDCAAPAPCCGDAAVAPATGDAKKDGQSTPPVKIPMGDKDKVDLKTEKKVEKKVDTTPKVDDKK